MKVVTDWATSGSTVGAESRSAASCVAASDTDMGGMAPPLLEPPLPGPAVAKDEAFISAMMRLGEEAGGGAAIGADQEPGQETDQGGGATEGQVSEVAVLGALVVLAAFAGGAMRRRHGARNV